MSKIRYERPTIKKLNFGTINKFGTQSLHLVTSHRWCGSKRYDSKIRFTSFCNFRNTNQALYQDAYRAFGTRYPKVQFAWSYKTNYLSAVCRVFHKKGAWADIVPSFDDFAEAISTTLLNVGFDPNKMPLLILETGRALIDEAGFLLGFVLANKRLSDGRRATIMDFGVNLLFTPNGMNTK